MSQPKAVVQASIIHQIIKEAHQDSVTPPLIRKNLHADSVQVCKLIEFLDEQLEKNGLAHSHVEAFDSPDTLGEVLSDYLCIIDLKLLNFTKPTNASFYNIFARELLASVPSEPDEDRSVLRQESLAQTRYRRITNHLTKALHYHVYEEPMTTGDHLPMIFYTLDGIEYLDIALLSLTDAITINEETGEIIDTNHIDASNLKIACRINITKFKDHKYKNLESTYQAENYIQWIQKGTSSKIPEYIQDFLPIRIRLDDTVATTKLMRSLINYLKQSPFSEQAKKEVQSEVLTILSHKAKHKRSVNIVDEIDPILATKSTLSNLSIADKDSFKTFRGNNGYGASDENNSNIFAPATEPLKNYEMFSFNLGEEEILKVSGSRSLLGEEIKLKESDNDEAVIEIKVSSENLPKIRKIFK